MKKYILPILAAMLLCGCGGQTESAVDADEMHYIKSVSLYDTITDMYNNTDAYIGKQYHMVGTLYPSTDENGTFYSVYAPDSDGDDGIGIELDWNDYSGLNDYDTITVEGRLEIETGTFDGATVQYLILRVSSIEKRES